ncbi:MULTISPECIES: hypothetical protein [unclassified Roseibium]|uniref:hypothetical protein n=1 Tax=unclassified Roseibium TaxID=2629323 RepID=UPI00273FCBC2|nr:MULTISPECIES: hypothetical protein [unclassified Roseibium]
MVVKQVNKLDLQCAAGMVRNQVLSVAGVTRIRLLYEVAEMECVANIIGKGVLGPHFARSMNDISPGHLMVMVAYAGDEHSERPVGMVAARYDDKPGWDLKDFLSAHWSRLYPSEKAGEFAEFLPESCLYAQGITGPFSYIGDGWISKEFRGSDLLGLIQKLLIMLAYDEWKPALTYGWMRPDKVLKGYAARWGYSMVYPRGIEWRVPPAQIDLRDVYFVGVDQVGIRQMVLDLTYED